MLFNIQCLNFNNFVRQDKIFFSVLDLKFNREPVERILCQGNMVSHIAFFSVHWLLHSRLAEESLESY